MSEVNRPSSFLIGLHPDMMAHDADLIGPAPPAMVKTSRIWNVWKRRWKQS